MSIGTVISALLFTYTTTFEGRDSYLESTVSGTSSDSRFKPTTNTLTYDAAGRLLSQREHTTLSSGTLPDRMRYYSNNADGMVQSRRDGRIENGVFVQGDPALPDDPKPNFQFVNANGQQVAQLREGGEVTLAATKQQAASTRTEDTMLSVAGTSPYAAGGGKVLVQEGDTLSTLAQRVYGNRSLWYVLAQANGLSDPDGPLTAGTALNAPSVSVNKNDASTFRPYNPAEAIGPTSPELPFIDPPKQGCNVLATLIVAAIMVAVTVYTAGAAATAISGASTAISGTAVLTGTAGLTIGETMAAAFVGGFAGSVASQAAGMALGVTDHLSLRSAVGSGLTTALTARIGMKLGGSTAEFLKDIKNVGAGKVAASALLTAGASVAGSRVSGTAFSWKAIAASAVSDVVSAGIGQALHVKAPNLFGDAGSIPDNIANGMIGGIVSVHTRRQFGFNDRIDYGNIAADAFGNALGNAVVGVIKDQRLRKQQELAVQLNDRAQAISTEAQSRLDEALQARNKDIDQYLQDRLADGLQTRLDKRQDALQDKLSAGLSKQNDEAVAALVREAAIRKAASERAAARQGNALADQLAHSRLPDFSDLMNLLGGGLPQDVNSGELVFERVKTENRLRRGPQVGPIPTPGVIGSPALQALGAVAKGIPTLSTLAQSQLLLGPIGDVATLFGLGEEVDLGPAAGKFTRNAVTGDMMTSLDVQNAKLSGLLTLFGGLGLEVSAVRGETQVLRNLADEMVANVASAEAAAARELLAKMAKVEPQVTNTLVEVAAANRGEMIGLEYRLKSVESLTRKIGSQPGIPVNDALRYTISFDEAGFTPGVQSAMTALEEQGYQLTVLRNTFKNGQPYKGINATYLTPEGEMFELQFHTPESFRMKDVINHQLYEQQRLLPRTDPLWASLRDRMIQNSSGVPIPPGAPSIKIPR